MSCGTDGEQMLSRYVDGELSAEEKEQVERHVTDCPMCRDTLEIFRRNESLLSNALQTEAFGNVVIESVLRELNGGGAPPQARPVEEGLGDWFRSRPWIRWGAAAVLLAGLSILWMVSSLRQADLAETARGLRTRLEEAEEARRDLAEITERQRDEYERTIQKLVLDRAMQPAGDFSAVAFVEPRYVVVRGSFNRHAYTGYSVFRQELAGDDGAVVEDAYAELTRERLSEPFFTDTTVRPGATYVYKFRAWREDGGYSDYAPQLISVPRGDFHVLCEEIGLATNTAIFTIEKVVDGRKAAAQFVVRVGERLGGPRVVGGIGDVDFSTGLELEKLEEGTQTLEVTYHAPIYDEEGRPIYERLGKNTFVPATMARRHDVRLYARPNLRAWLRPWAAAPSTHSVHVWKGRSGVWVKKPQ